MYGKGTAYPAAFATSALDGTNGFTIGTSTEEYLGAFVGFIGDEAPRYAVAVVLESGGGGLGSAVAIGRDMLLATIEAAPPEA